MTFDLRQLKAELMVEETRKVRFEADKAEYDAHKSEMTLNDMLANSDANRHMTIVGPIMDTENAIIMLNRWSRRDPGEPITISINSPGGSVFDGNALYDTILKIRRKGTHVTTIGTGMVMSYGAILLQAGDERVLDANTTFMIHGLSAPVFGDIDTIMDRAAMFKKVQDQLVDILAERAKISKAKIKTLIKRKDLFLTADEALKYGFADRVE